MEGNRSFCFYLHMYALICSKYLIPSKSVDIRFISRRKYEGLNYRRRKLRNEKGIATTDALNKISISYGVKRNNRYHHIISIHGSLDFGWADHFTIWLFNKCLITDFSSLPNQMANENCDSSNYAKF